MTISTASIAAKGNPVKFYDLETAKDWRAEFGGWIFSALDMSAIWFPASWTPSLIFKSRFTRGLSGELL